MQKAIIGKKVGMTQIFDESGKVIPGCIPWRHPLPVPAGTHGMTTAKRPLSVPPPQISSSAYYTLRPRKRQVKSMSILERSPQVPLPAVPPSVRSN